MTADCLQGVVDKLLAARTLPPPRRRRGMAAAGRVADRPDVRQVIHTQCLLRPCVTRVSIVGCDSGSSALHGTHRPYEGSGAFSGNASYLRAVC